MDNHHENAKCYSNQSNTANSMTHFALMHLLTKSTKCLSETLVHIFKLSKVYGKTILFWTLHKLITYNGIYIYFGIPQCKLLGLKWYQFKWILSYHTMLTNQDMLKSIINMQNRSTRCKEQLQVFRTWFFIGLLVAKGS